VRRPARVECSVNKMYARYLSVSREHSSPSRASGTIFTLLTDHHYAVRAVKKQENVVTTVPTILHAPATQMAATTPIPPTADLLSLPDGMHHAARAFDLCRIACIRAIDSFITSFQIIIGARSHRRPKTNASNRQRYEQ